MVDGPAQARGHFESRPGRHVLLHEHEQGVAQDQHQRHRQQARQVGRVTVLPHPRVPPGQQAGKHVVIAIGESIRRVCMDHQAENAAVGPSGIAPMLGDGRLIHLAGCVPEQRHKQVLMPGLSADLVIRDSTPNQFAIARVRELAKSVAANFFALGSSTPSSRSKASLAGFGRSTLGQPDASSAHGSAANDPRGGAPRGFVHKDSAHHKSLSSGELLCTTNCTEA